MEQIPQPGGGDLEVYRPRAANQAAHKKTTLTKKLCVKQTPGAATISMQLLKRHVKKKTTTLSKKRARKEATARA